MEKLRPAAWDLTIPTPEAAAAPAPSTVHSGDSLPWNALTVRRLAHELEDAATLLHDRYRQVSDDWKWWHWQKRFDALNALAPLASGARHLNSQLSGRDQSPAATREDFNNISRWLDQVQAKLPGAYRSAQVAAEHDAVRRIFTSLAAFYRLPGGHENVWRHWEKVRDLARSVDGMLKPLVREAERRATIGDHWERLVLSELHQFSAQSRHFSNLIENPRDHRNSQRSSGDFGLLLKIHSQLTGNLAQAHFEPYLREDFAKISSTVKELESYYGDGKPAN